MQILKGRGSSLVYHLIRLAHFSGKDSLIQDLGSTKGREFGERRGDGVV